MRKRTGLRNRFRSGRSTYSVKSKGRESDSYGSWSGGRPTRVEVIAGRSLTMKPRVWEE